MLIIDIGFNPIARNNVNIADHNWLLTNFAFHAGKINTTESAGNELS